MVDTNDKKRDQLEEAKKIVANLRKALGDTEEDMDTWLVSWARSDWSLGIAVSFGLTLLLIGYAAGKFL